MSSCCKSDMRQSETSEIVVNTHVFVNGIQEVDSSILFSSTIIKTRVYGDSVDPFFVGFFVQVTSQVTSCAK